VGVVDRYKAKRKFRKRDTAAFDSHVARTEATLLEYGEKIFSAAVRDEETEEKKAKASKGRGSISAKVENLDQVLGGGQKASTDDSKSKEKIAEEEQKRIDDLKKQLDVIDGVDTNSVSGKNVLKFMGLTTEEIKQAKADYDEQMQKQLQEEQDEEKLPIGKRLATAFQRQLDALNRKLAQQQQKREKKIEAVKILEEKLKALRRLLQEKNAAKDLAQAEASKLEEEEKVLSTSNQALLQKLKSLVTLNESLKVQELQFKANCKQQREQLNEMIKKLDSGESDEEIKRVHEIEQIFDTDLNKLSKMRQVLAKKNQEISTIARSIDDIPTRAELLQYESRFVELYELVAEKLKETRKYFALYNTLEESHRYMANEVTLLNQISEGFPKAMKSKPGRDNLIEQLKNILEGVAKTFEQAEKELKQETSTKEALNEKYNALLEKQRTYFKTVKEFQDECFKNEKLTETLERLTQQLQI